MASNSWILEETTLPKLGFLGQGIHGYVSLVRTPDDLFMAKKTSLHKYSENLEKELRILQHFNSYHINIVRPSSPIVYYETKPVNVRVCSIYMEIAPHGSLKDMITNSHDGSLPENVAGSCTLPILEGLRDLHRDGYVHCDLRPENILIFPTYTHGELCELKLADFSLAKEPNGPSPVNGSLFVGNPEYLAPEARGPRGRITSAVDVWSLGVTVCEMLGVAVGGGGAEGGGRTYYFPGRLSLTARSFLRRCFVRKPEARATVEELMSHPFVTQSLEVPPVELLPVPPCLSGGMIRGRFL